LIHDFHFLSTWHLMFMLIALRMSTVFEHKVECLKYLCWICNVPAIFDTCGRCYVNSLGWNIFYRPFRMVQNRFTPLDIIESLSLVTFLFRT